MRITRISFDCFARSTERSTELTPKSQEPSFDAAQEPTNYMVHRVLGTGWLLPVLLYSKPISVKAFASGMIIPSNWKAGFCMSL